MSWVRIDDEFYDHPKFLDLDSGALALWCVSLAYCNRYGTDGFIPAGAPRRVMPQHPDLDALTAELVRRRLWDVEDGGWRMHDYHDFQPTADEIREKKRRRAESGRLGGLRSGEARRSKNEANASAVASSKRLSKNEARGLNPTPPQPITTSSFSVGLESDTPPVDNSTVGEALSMVTDERMRNLSVAPMNPTAYRATVARNVETEFGPEARRVAAAYPAISASQLAGVLNGNRTILRYLERAS